MSDINPQRFVDLINELLASSAEKSWVEFKHNNSDHNMIGVRVSAISNGARLAGKQTGYILWGIEDHTRRVVGTNFDPDTLKVGNQIFSMWLAQRLSPSIVFKFYQINHPAGRIVLMEVPAATAVPVAFNEMPYIRVGSATPKLSDYPEYYQALLEAMRPYAWEHGIAMQYITSDQVIDLIDYTQYFRLTRQPLPDNKAGILDKLAADQVIASDVGGRWNITNLGAILFAVDLNKFSSVIARKAIRFVAYSGLNRASNVTHRHDGIRGYANGFEGLMTYINGLLPRNEHIDIALRQERPLFPELALRELVANALVHQDMTISGAGPQIELFQDRMEITNPGRPLIKPERMIDMPPRSRNEALASHMRRMGFCEEQGSGLDKVIAQVEIFQLPAPLFREVDTAFQVILYSTRKFAQMTTEERIRACYHHAVLKFLSGDRMKNSSLCERFGIERQNAAQASNIISQALEMGFIKPADQEHPRSGYVPSWA